MGLLTFIRSAHYWTLMHPELLIEDDLKELLRQHEELAQLLSEKAETGHLELGTRLFEELETLRDLNKRQELENTKRALEERDQQKNLMLKEVDHRIKNSLQIVSSLLQLQARSAGADASQFQKAASRISAIATVHKQLHKSDYVGTVPLDQYISDLCQEIAWAAGIPSNGWSVVIDGDPRTIANDIAVPLALIVNELFTNAIQHSRPMGEGGAIYIVVNNHSDDLSLSVSDFGAGPDPGQIAIGLGTQIIDALLRQLNGTVTRQSTKQGYSVTVKVPRRGSNVTANFHTCQVH